MTSDAAQMLAQQAAQASLEASAAARQVAELALSQHKDVLAGFGELRQDMAAQRIVQVEMRADLRRIEALAVTTAAQATLTNGHITKLNLWRAEMKGVAQGAGGTGRLMLYMLTAGAAATAITAGLLTLASRIN